jgi:hypothetical protein
MMATDTTMSLKSWDLQFEISFYILIKKIFFIQQTGGIGIANSWSLPLKLF